MNIIATKDLNNIRYMLGAAETAKGVYNQIKATFPTAPSRPSTSKIRKAK